MNILLNEILAAREARAARQQTLLAQHGCPLVSFTMNIAGPVKTSPLIRRAFAAGLEALEAALEGYPIRHREQRSQITGEEAIFCVAADAFRLKEICATIEEATPLGRLFDMDVLDVQGRKLERSRERGCLVCGAPGRSCAAGRRHSVQSLQEATRKRITDHFDGPDAAHIGDVAVEALLREVRTTPKPGLVDLRNNGSHRDMHPELFAVSARALRQYFTRCAAIGQETAELSPAGAFPSLKEAGLEAEKVMYAATNGVNTHKGAIYTLGILCAVFGRLRHTGETNPPETEVFSLCAAIAGDAARADLEQAAADTAGLRLYRRLGIAGIRGEMAQGLPSVEQTALPVFRAARSQGYSDNDAGVFTLLHLMARVQDTNLYHRGGEAGVAFAAEAVRTLLKDTAYPELSRVEALDDALIARNLSPGGCADLLAATYFLMELM